MVYYIVHRVSKNMLNLGFLPLQFQSCLQKNKGYNLNYDLVGFQRKYFNADTCLSGRVKVQIIQVFISQGGIFNCLQRTYTQFGQLVNKALVIHFKYDLDHYYMIILGITTRVFHRHSISPFILILGIILIIMGQVGYLNTNKHPIII